MPIRRNRPLKIFSAYAFEDEGLQKSLEMHLAVLRRNQGYTIGWSKNNIGPGKDLEAEIDRNLETSDIILLLISVYFFTSEQCCKQMNRALEIHQSGEARVVPIILRSCIWKRTQIGKLQVLPRNEIPIIQWKDRDQAFEEIANEISIIVAGLISGIDEEVTELLKNFNKYYFQMEMPDEDWIKTILDRQSYFNDRFFILHKIEALVENTSSLWWADRLTPLVLLLIEQKVAENYSKHVKYIFRSIFGYREHDDIDDLRSYHANLVSRHFLAKIAYKRSSKVLRPDPDNIKALYIQSVALTGLGKNEEALAVAERVRKLDPHFPYICDLECAIFAHLGRIEEALTILEQAMHLNPDDTEDYKKVKVALTSLRKPAKWLQLTLPPPEETLALPQLAESLFLSQTTGEISADLDEPSIVGQDDSKRQINLDMP